MRPSSAGTRRGPGEPRRPSLGRRHARQHLQRHAARGRAGPGGFHAGIRAAPRLTTPDSMTYRILTLNAHQPQGTRAAAARALRGGRGGHRPGCDPGALGRHAHVQRPAHGARRGRAGAGTNNIPVEAMSRRGIPVFNAPGANANAVKELVLAGLLLAARNICAGLAVRPQPAAAMTRPRGSGGSGQEALRRLRAPGTHARGRRPRRHRGRGGQFRASRSA